MKPEPPQGEPTQSLPDCLLAASEEDVKYLQHTLEHLIDHMHQRVEYAESRRYALVTVAGVLAAASVALIALALNKDTVDWIRWPTLVFSAATIVLALLTYFTYFRQTNYPYPFAPATTTWKWFYRDALKDLAPFSPRWPLLESKQAKKKSQEAFATQWQAYLTERLPSLLAIRESAYQDIQQVFVLHVNERYKNHFLSQLRKMLFIGLAISLILALVSLLPVGIRQHVTMGQVHQASSQEGVDASWRDTGLTRPLGSGDMADQLLVNIQVNNGGATTKVVSSIAAKDTYGLVLPVSVQSIDPSQPTIQPKSTVRIVALVWIPASVRNRLDHFEIEQ